MAPEICANCGADVPRNAKACPECGSDEQTGWSEEAAAADLGLPDDSFDYDKFVREELEGSERVRDRASWYWWVIAAVGILILVAALTKW
jgi:zinc-ribbon domain